MSKTAKVRALSLVVGVCGLVVCGSSAWSQPSSRSPLAPPANGPRKSEPGDGYVALTGATVHVKPGQVIERGTVVMRGGKIEDVVTETVAGMTSAPLGAEERDCSGMHIYAGFVEPYFEVEVPRPDPNAPGTHWNSHVMPQRNALDKGAAGISAKDAETMRSMGFVAAAISPKGGIFRGSSTLVSLAQISGDPSDASPRVYADHVYQCVSLETSREDEDGRPVRGMPRPTEDAHWTRYPDSEMGSIALVRQTLSDADWAGGRRELQRREGKRADDIGALGEVGTPVNLIAMYPTSTPEEAQAQYEERVRPSRPLLFDCEDELQDLRAMKIAAEFGRHVDVLGSGLEFRRLEAIQRAAKDHSFGFVLPLNYPKTPKVGSVGEADAVELKELINWEQAPTNPRRLDAAGVTVALTTSKVPEKLGGHKAFKEHLSTAIKDGLKADRALAMLTTNAAQVLGVSDEFGTVEKGRVASLIVADGELFTDKPDAPKKGEPGYVRAGRIVDVWIDGRRHVVAPKQRRDLGGTWDVTLTPGPKAGSNVRISYEIDDDYPPAFTIVKRTTEDGGKEQRATTKAQGVAIDENGAIRFTFDHEPFGEKGVFVSSGVIEKDDKGELVMRGEAVRAGGEMLRWTANRTSTEIPKAEKKKRGDDEQVAAKDAKPEPEGDEAAQKKPKKSKTPEADAIASIPQELGLPLGAYASVNVPFQRTCIIKNATIWTCGPKGVIENGAILINDGKIVIVGSADDIAKWPDMPHAISQQPWTIDAQGKHVTPGIIDCHSHTGISKGVNESGQAVTAEVRIGDVTDPDSISWYRQLAAGVTTVNSLHGSANPIGGQNQVNKNRWGCIAPEDMHFVGAMPGIKFALGENVKQSNGDRQSTRYPVTRMGVETLMRDRFTAAREYAAAMKGEAGREEQWKKDHADQMRTKDWGWNMRAELGAQPRRDLELEALAEILEGKRIIHCHSYRQDEILMLCRIADEFGFKIGTFQHGLEVYKVADVVKTHAGGASLFADWWAYKVEVQDAIPYAGPLQTEVGVLTSYNSDSDEMARRLNVEAGKAAKYSHGHLSAEEALRFVTINPAKQLRIDDKVGSIEAGKDADIAIWSGPPLSSMSRCERTFVDGREMFSLEKDADLRKQNAAERARIIQKVLALKDKGGDRAKKDGEGDGPGPDAGKPVDEDELAGNDRRSILLQAYSQADDLRREQFLDLLRRGFDPRFHTAGDCGCYGN
jgi:N-acetylglucosamine-6-phosphate deacetylase